MGDVHQYADQLRQYATHFAMRDWDYTRDLGALSGIRYDRPEEQPLGRVRSSLGWLFGRREAFASGWGPNRFQMARYALRRDPNLPDGQLDNGNILTHWEETGEYLQYVQPSVGALLADLMDAHPDLPEVQAVADEMKRISDRYGERLAAQHVD